MSPKRVAAILADIKRQRVTVESRVRDYQAEYCARVSQADLSAVIAAVNSGDITGDEAAEALERLQDASPRRRREQR